MTQEAPNIHSQIGHYTGVMRSLVEAHTQMRVTGDQECNHCEKGHNVGAPADDRTIAAVAATIQDVARLISKLVSQVETTSGVGVH